MNASNSAMVAHDICVSQIDIVNIPLLHWPCLGVKTAAGKRKQKNQETEMIEKSVRRRSQRRQVVFGLSVLAGLIHQAYAQEAAAPAQDNGAQVIPAVQADTSVVKVTGYRASLLSSAKDKKEAIGFQDTISAE